MSEKFEPQQVNAEQKPEVADSAQMADVHGDEVEFGETLRGRRLGHYRLGEWLGGGVVAAVYRARDEQTGDPVAVKTLLSGADSIMRERFRREAQLVSKLQHPHIVETLVVSQSDEREPGESIAFIVMEMVEGCSLAQLLERQGRLSPSDACGILAPIAEALDYAHGLDIVHRDVKPSNILLRREEGNPEGSVRVSALDYAVTPLLTDFGIARAMDAPELTSEGRTIGTPAFMSPEQCAGNEEIDGRSDVYGLGAVLYRCLVGKTPYSGSTTQMLYAHVYEPLLIPEEMVNLLPPIVLTTLQRAMMKDPAHRYQAAGEIAQDLALASGKLPEGDAHAPSSTVTMPALDVVRRDEQATPARVLVPVVGPAQTRAQALPPERRRTTIKLEEAVAPAHSNSAHSNSAHSSSTHSNSMHGHSAWGNLGWNSPARAARPVRRTRRAWSRSMTLVTLAALLVVAVVSALALTLFDDVPESMAALVSRQPTPAAGVAGIDGLVETGVEPEEGDVASPGITVPGFTGEPDDSGVAESSDSATPDPATLGNTRGPGENGAGMVTDALTDTVTATVVIITPAAVTATVPVTGTPLPPDVSLPLAWQDALDAFDAEEWEEARAQLLMVRQLDPEHETALVGAMLAMVNAELAEAAYEAGELLPAVELLRAAAAEQADPELTERLELAFAAYQDDDDDDGATVEELRAALADVADELSAADAPCSALLYGNVAVALGSGVGEDVTGLTWLEGLVEACEAQRRSQPPALEGRLIYSSQENDVYRIFAMPVTAPGSSTLLVENAAQPQLRGDGRLIAFYSWQRGQTGLAGLDNLTGQNPAGRSLHYTEHSEDSRDSPPSWSPHGDRLAYSSTSFGDGRYRIYVAQADGSRQVAELGWGKDPAWHPWQDLLVFNGVDENGEQPGLWLMRSDGSERRRLTDNGNDQRPVWTPDGRSVVFMSSGRHDNWELYRLNFEDSSITRLTYSNAQDGLPAISPDGNFVAFVSDRDGFWNFWYIPVLGGDAVRLGPMSGQMISWLEHGVQWVR